MTAFAPHLRSTREVLELIYAERQRQEERYGSANAQHPSGTGPNTRWLLPFTSESASAIEQLLRDDYEDFEDEAGGVTWLHLVREEIAEAFELPEGDPRLAEELIQVAALCVAWVEHLRP